MQDIHMFNVKKHAGAYSSQFYGGVAVLFKQQIRMVSKGDWILKKNLKSDTKLLPQLTLRELWKKEFLLMTLHVSASLLSG